MVSATHGMTNSESKTFEIPDHLGGARLDVALAELVASWSRSRLQQAIKDGAVQVGGVEVRRPNTAVKAGELVEMVLDESREVSTDVDGRAIRELDVIFSDDQIAVINKPAGLVTHSNARQKRGTVADLAVARFGPLPEVQGEDRPGIVHRLDRLTSGVMILGLTLEALEGLKAQFKDRRVAKTYHAIVHGEPRFDSEWRTGAIAASVKTPDRMRVVAERLADEMVDAGDARTAETLIERIEDFGCASLVAAKPKTGRTHQIRVHLQHAGLPIIGDRLYGPKGAVKAPLPKSVPKMQRPALHARELCVDHPVTGERLTFSAPIPDDMQAVLDALRAARG